MALKMHTLWKENHFKIAQTLFAIAISFSYFGDVTMRIFLGLSFLCLCKSDFSEGCGVERENLWLLRLLEIWLIWCFVVPIFSPGGLEMWRHGITIPFELSVWLLTALFYSRNEFFFKVLRQTLFGAAAVFFVCVFIQRWTVSFQWGPEHWLFQMFSWDVGGYYCLLAPCLLDLSISSDGWRRPAAMGALVIALIVLILTFSSAFWAGALAQFALLATLTLFSKRGRIIHLITGALTVIVICCLIIGGIGNLRQITEQRGKEEIQQLASVRNLDKFTTKREVVWSSAWHMIRRYPLFGWGYKYFRDIMQREDPKSYAALAGGYPHAHSFYLQCAWSVGIPGAMMAVFFLLGLLWQDLKRCQQRMTSPALVSCLLIAAYCTIGLVEDLFDCDRRLMIPFWCLMVLGLKRLPSEKQADKNVQKSLKANGMKE